jgi:hypothetical protein
MIAPFWRTWKKWKRSPLKLLGISCLTLVLVTGTPGFTRTKTRLVSWFWQMKGLPSEGRVLASGNGPRVVWVHDEDATNWDYGRNYYGREEYVDQSVINEMADQGLMALTGASTVADAWRELLPQYQPGQTIAIKVNLNSNWEHSLDCQNKCEINCDQHDLRINALPQPVNALIRGLKLIGVDETDIWVYEASKPMTERFVKRITSLYPDVTFFDDSDRGCQAHESWDLTSVDFQPPGGIADPEDRRLSNVVVKADYLINMPIMKKHGGAGLSLSFKNHFGSIDIPGRLHPWIFGPGTQHAGDHYSLVYSPMVDIYLNPNIADKTVLTVGDGLYGDRKDNTNKPRRWDSFGNDSPNSLFFSRDPVAIDSVMADILHAEGYDGGVLGFADDYLKLAADEGLGVYERGDPWRGSEGYTRINLIRCQDGVCLETPPSPSPTPTASPTVTHSATATVTSSPTATLSATSVSTPTATSSSTPTATPSSTLTGCPTATPSETHTVTPNPTSTDTPVSTPTPEDNHIYLPIILKSYSS